jgi:phosphotransferase system enzyme I (PtsI)
MTQELRMRGVAVSPGIVIGKAYVRRPEEVVVPNFVVDASKVDAEIERFHAALAQTRDGIRDTRARLADQMATTTPRSSDAHLLILEDTKAIEDTEELIRKQLMCAEFAFNRVIGRILESFESIGDAYLKERRADIQDVRRRLLRNLTGQESRSFGALNQESVIVAHDLLPSDTAMIDRRFVLGIATDVGGRTSHAAILARSYGIAAVVGLEGLTEKTQHGEAIIVDGNMGVVVLRPSPETLHEYEQARQRFVELERQMLTPAEFPAITLDGRKIELSANIKSPDDAALAIAKARAASACTAPSISS